MHGEPALPPDFDHPRYANPDAPKGGRLTQGVLGTFDSLNPFIVKGLALSQIRGYVVESLLARGYDEPFTLYGLLARTVETDADRTYVTFALDPAAKFSDGKPVTADGRDVLLAAAARQGPAELPHLLRQGRQGRGAVGARGALRSGRRQRPRTAADPRPDAGAGQARHQSRHVRGHDLRADRRQRPLRGRQGRSRPQHHLEARSQLLGPRPCRSTAASGISTRSASTSTATAIRISRRSRKASTTCAPRPIPGRWETAYDVPAVRDGRIVKETFPYGLPKIIFRPRLQHPPAGVRRHPRARGDRHAVRLRMAQPQLLLRPLRALRELLRRLRAFGARPAGRRARARAAGAVSRRGARRHHGRHLAAAGDRRLRPRPRHAQARARASGRRRLRARRHRAALARDATSRSPSRSWSPPGIRSGSRSPSRATSSAPASPRACASSTPCNTTGGDSPTIST